MVQSCGLIQHDRCAVEKLVSVIRKGRAAVSTKPRQQVYFVQAARADVRINGILSNCSVGA
jgi:hypothetical protein